jgi:hypothetical protein
MLWGQGSHLTWYGDIYTQRKNKNIFRRQSQPQSILFYFIKLIQLLLTYDIDILYKKTLV